MQLLAHSPHRGPVDAARLGSLLNREVPNEFITWVHSLGVAQARNAVRIPQNPGLGFDYHRVSVPVRSSGLLLGYLWIIDPGGLLADDKIEIAERAAAEIAAIMHRDRLLDQMRSEQENQLARDLLSADPDLRANAAQRIEEFALCPRGVPYTAIVARVSTQGIAADTASELTLVNGLDRVGRALHPRHWLHTVIGDKAVVAFACEVRTTPEEFARALYDATLRMQPDRTALRVGMGDPQPTLDQLGVSYQQAISAITIAASVGRADPVTAWSDLGVYRLLSVLSAEQLTNDALPLGLVALLEAEGCEDLVTTLESYLDHGGAVKETAAELFVQRGSLYHRLSRIEKITGVDLANGEDRLLLHLGLKAARLLGRLPGSRPATASRYSRRSAS
jgi:sugar diacid utilization regulator